MPLKFRVPFYPPIVEEILEIPSEDISEEEEEGGDYLFNPEAGKASDNPFAHLRLEDDPKELAASDEDVSKYVTGEE
jgi:hypothetical protein|tara:strand:- start:359 stop:589 length:231 start_codon:yes stop_codon:yes gene_type:complete